jgi:chromosome segregation ATPase
MDEAVGILQILTEVAPLALSTLILALVLLFVMWLALKLFVPMVRESIQMFEAQRNSWQAVIAEQNRINRLLSEELQHDLEEERAERKKLEARVAEMEAELARKDARIQELQAEVARHQAKITELQKALADKDMLIRNLRDELNHVQEDRKRVERERDDLLHRIEALEKAQRERPDGHDQPAKPEVNPDVPTTTPTQSP